MWLTLGLAVVGAHAQMTLSVPPERAAGLALPVTVAAAPAGQPVTIERRTARGWHALRTLRADTQTIALKTPFTTTRWRLRARSADGTTSAAVPVTIRPVTLDAVGDINLGDGPGGQIAAHGSRYPWGDVAPVLTAADVAFGNLECAVSTRGAEVPKTYHFRARPSSLPAVHDFAGLDVVNLANNHLGDYGPIAIADTVRNVRRAGLLGAGAGLDTQDAATPRVIERLGLKIAFVGFSDIGPASFAAGPHRPGTRWATLANVRHDIQAARRRANIVIASFHWGIEYDPRPTARQKQLANAALAAGATAVIAAHPHILQPVVRATHRRVIAYSLGNFVFQPRNAIAARTGILELSLSTRGVERVHLRRATIVRTRPRLS
jgi:hypothetical protein